MKCVLETPQFAVFDDVLAPEELLQLNKYTSVEAELEFINTTTYQRVWSLNDGHPLASPTVILDAVQEGAAARALQGAALEGPEYFSYPSSCAIDLLVERLLREVPRFEPWIGRAGAAWKAMTARALLYPQGTSLDWHEDGDAYTGAYTFYTHLEWRPAWGGELLVASTSEPTVKPDCGAFVSPRPNRLVIIRGGTPHKICRVSNLAGENIRQAVSGFFDKRDVEEATGA